jgi:hypothetical protein
MIVLVLHGVLVELVFASGTAKEICLSSVLGVCSSGGGFNVHAANGVFHNGCAAHWDLLGL